MARPLRPLVAGGVYHVTTRGMHKRAIFLDDKDRETLLEELDRVVRRFGWRCLSFCLMTNHFHLLVKTPEPNLPRGMQVLKSTYAQRFNARHKRTDSVFGRRYGAILVQEDTYLKVVFRYIALNPVRADLCAHPRQFAWSGHGALEGQCEPRAFHAVDDALWYFDDQRERYASFVASTPELEFDPTGVVFGDDDFKRAVLPSLRPSPEIVERHWGEGRPSLDAILAAKPGGPGIADAYRLYGYRLGDIATVLGRHVSTVSRALRAFELRENKI